MQALQSRQWSAESFDTGVKHLETIHAEGVSKAGQDQQDSGPVRELDVFAERFLARKVRMTTAWPSVQQ